MPPPGGAPPPSPAVRAHRSPSPSHPPAYDARVSEPTVRRATSADTQAAGATLATAFHDDPVLSYLLPVADQRPARATRFFMMMTRIQLGLGHVYLQAAA